MRNRTCPFCGTVTHLFSCLPHLNIDTNTSPLRHLTTSAMGARTSRLPHEVGQRARRIRSMLSTRAAHASSPLVANPLFIVEVLEAILLRVDQRTLLVACLRVSKTWNQVISNLLVLMQHLHLLPDEKAMPDESELQKHPELRYRYPVNPLLKWGFSSWFLNNHELKNDPTFEPRELYEFFESLPWSKNLVAWRRKKASWRRMQISQPPHTHTSSQHVARD